MPPLLIVDGDNLAHRAYHTSPKSIVGPQGEPINAMVGFISILTKLWTQEPTRGVFVAWDTLGVDTYRNKLWPNYQSGRVFEPSIVAQLNLLPTLCEAFGFGVGKLAGYEADDLIASAAAQEVRSGGTAVIYTADKDSFQLVNDSVTVLVPQRGGLPPLRVSPSEVVSLLGVLPEQVVDFKALAGDPSDKIPGAQGIGPKTAASLLLKHGTLDSVLTEWDRCESGDLLRVFRQVVTMETDAIVTLPSSPPDWAAGAQALRVLGAETLANRVEALSG